MIKKVAQHSQIEFEYYQIIKRSQNNNSLEEWKEALTMAGKSFDASKVNLQGIKGKSKSLISSVKNTATGIVGKAKAFISKVKNAPAIGDVVTAILILNDLRKTIMPIFKILQSLKGISESKIKLSELSPKNMPTTINKYKDNPKVLGILGSLSGSLEITVGSLVGIIGNSINIIESIAMAPVEVGSGGTALAAEVSINIFINYIIDLVKSKASAPFKASKDNIIKIIQDKIKQLGGTTEEDQNSSPNQIQNPNPSTKPPVSEEGTSASSGEITSQAAKSKDKDYKKSKTKRTKLKVKAKKVKM